MDMKKAEAVKALKTQMRNKGWDIYNDIYSDCPRHGYGHYVCAAGFIADRLYDEFYSNPLLKSINISAVVKTLDLDDDRAETRKNERKAQRKPKIKHPKPIKVKAWDDYPPKNKGVGSF
jgi:hypothetical protein